jgi:alpha-tubulin suppressor-like RCC1 family protein
MSLLVRAFVALALLYAASASATGMLANVRQVSAGDTHSCAVLGDSTVACWGSNGWGELGDGGTTARARPARVIDAGTGSAMTGFSQVATGSAMTCGLRGVDVYCWGYAYPGVAQPFPTRIAVGAPVKSVALKSEFVCVLLATAERSIRCWGDNDDGQLGDGTQTSRGTPADVVITERDGSHALLGGITQITAGADHACAVLDDTSVACWGFNLAGELGNNTYADSLSPVAVTIDIPAHPKLSGIRNVTANGLHSCATFASTSQVACWGNNVQGQLGDPAVTYVIDSPVGVAVAASTIDAGEESTCAMLPDGRLACWGGNTYGQLANGSTGGTERVPNVVLSLPKIASLSVGTYHACAVLPDTTVRCWGRGDSGELGSGSPTPASANPVPVADLQ